MGVPTDCPQRDERLGWMADAQVFWRTASYNMDLAAFTRKYAGGYARHAGGHAVLWSFCAGHDQGIVGIWGGLERCWSDYSVDLVAAERRYQRD